MLSSLAQIRATTRANHDADPSIGGNGGVPHTRHARASREDVHVLPAYLKAAVLGNETPIVGSSRRVAQSLVSWHVQHLAQRNDVAVDGNTAQRGDRGSCGSSAVWKLPRVEQIKTNVLLRPWTEGGTRTISPGKTDGLSRVEPPAALHAHCIVECAGHRA